MKPITLLPIILLLIIYTCKNKTVIINGKTVDSKSGQPIEGVNLSCSIVDGTTYYSKEFIDINTNKEGNFYIEYEEGDGLSNLFVRKDGYYIKNGFGDSFYDENSRETILFMHPRDATLRLFFQNTSGQFDSLLIGVYSSLYASENGFSQGGTLISYTEDILPLAVGQVDSMDFAVSKGEKIQVNWSGDLLERFYLRFNAPFKSLVFINQNDTTTHIISY